MSHSSPLPPGSPNAWDTRRTRQCTFLRNGGPSCRSDGHCRPGGGKGCGFKLTRCPGVGEACCHGQGHGRPPQSFETRKAAIEVSTGALENLTRRVSLQGLASPRREHGELTCCGVPGPPGQSGEGVTPTRGLRSRAPGFRTGRGAISFLAIPGWRGGSSLRSGF